MPCQWYMYVLAACPAKEVPVASYFKAPSLCCYSRYCPPFPPSLCAHFQAFPAKTSLQVQVPRRRWVPSKQILGQHSSISVLSLQTFVPVACYFKAPALCCYSRYCPPFPPSLCAHFQAFPAKTSLQVQVPRRRCVPSKQILGQHSPISVLFRCKHSFLLPVILKLQHCAVIRDTAHHSRLHFAPISKRFQPRLPYKFKFQDGGVFPPNRS